MAQARDFYLTGNRRQLPFYRENPATYLTECAQRLEGLIPLSELEGKVLRDTKGKPVGQLWTGKDAIVVLSLVPSFFGGQSARAEVFCTPERKHAFENLRLFS